MCTDSETHSDSSSNETIGKLSGHDIFNSNIIAGAGRITCHDSKDLPHEGEVVGLVKLRRKV